jgi:hypothetical protein
VMHPRAASRTAPSQRLGLHASRPDSDHDGVWPAGSWPALLRRLADVGLASMLTIHIDRMSRLNTAGPAGRGSKRAAGAGPTTGPNLVGGPGAGRPCGRRQRRRRLAGSFTTDAQRAALRLSADRRRGGAAGPGALGSDHRLFSARIGAVPASRTWSCPPVQRTCLSPHRRPLAASPTPAPIGAGARPPARPPAPARSRFSPAGPSGSGTDPEALGPDRRVYRGGSGEARAAAAAAAARRVLREASERINLSLRLCTRVMSIDS